MYSNKCSNEMINMTQILALTGGGGNEEKEDVLLVYLSPAHRREQVWMLQPVFCISKRRGCNPSASRVSADFQMTAANLNVTV